MSLLPQERGRDTRAMAYRERQKAMKEPPPQVKSPLEWTINTTHWWHYGSICAQLNATAKVVVNPDRSVKVFIKSMTQLDALKRHAVLDAYRTMRRQLRMTAVHRLNCSLSIPEIFELAGYRGDTAEWREENIQGSVNGLENGYTGKLLITNGVLGITRTHSLEFKLHQMSHWSPQRRGKVVPSGRKTAQPRKPAVKNFTDEEIAALLDDI